MLNIRRLQRFEFDPDLYFKRVPLLQMEWKLIVKNERAKLSISHFFTLGNPSRKDNIEGHLHFGFQLVCINVLSNGVFQVVNKVVMKLLLAIWGQKEFSKVLGIILARLSIPFPRKKGG